MLVLSRKTRNTEADKEPEDEILIIDTLTRETISVRVLKTKGRNVAVGIDCSQRYRIVRSEIYDESKLPPSRPLSPTVN
jgi:sRNA-binding carbon storage regulator CsrA